jgi:hypothetical protein
MMRRLVVVVLLVLPAGAVWAAEAVRSIGIYVQPYYESARVPGEAPRVAVGRQYDDLLASSRREDILAARDLIEAKPALVTPMTMMVLAIRLYDVGLRDDAVFWFYVAKDRYLVLADVADIKSPGLAQVEDAIGSFAQLAGPIINGYAFCDVAKQKSAHAKAVDWVERHPYGVMFMARVPAKSGDRAENHKRALAAAKERAAKESAYLDNAQSVAELRAQRKRNEVDAKYCWQ